MSISLLDELKDDINERQDELFSIQIALEDEARRASNFAKYLRIAVIFLGAFAATREAADRLYDSSSVSHKPVVVIYTLLGLAITVVGSI
jgi:Co/Zn/Cd efflux system component